MATLSKIKEIILSATSSCMSENTTHAGVHVKRQIFTLPYGMWKDGEGRRLCEISLFIEGTHSTTDFVAGSRHEGLGSTDGMRDGGDTVTTSHQIIGGEFSFSTASYATKSGIKCIIYKEEGLLQYSSL